MQMPNCDCGAVDESDHLPECIRGVAHEQWDIADEVAMEDGYQPARMRALMRHPSMRATRAYLKAQPLPEQQGGRRTA
jgi:hypothetical protein